MASRLLRSVLMGATVLCLCGPVLAEDEEPDPVILGIALTDAPMSLQKGLAASEPHGKPISAKFEVADKDVQLSVYTATATGFVEAILNPKTGAVVSAEPITDADDLIHANAQKAAMEKATVSLQAAAGKAIKRKSQLPGRQRNPRTAGRTGGRDGETASPERFYNRHGAFELTACRTKTGRSRAKVYRPLATSAVFLALTTLLPAAASAAEPGPLVLETTIPLPDVGGRIDHMAIDRARHRLIVAALGNGSVEVVDVDTGKPRQRIDGLKEPQGVAYADKADAYSWPMPAMAPSGFSMPADLEPLGRIDLKKDADNIRIDPRNENIVVGYGDGGLAIIDPATRTVIGTIALQGHPEGFQIENA